MANRRTDGFGCQSRQRNQCPAVVTPIATAAVLLHAESFEALATLDLPVAGDRSSGLGAGYMLRGHRPRWERLPQGMDQHVGESGRLPREALDQDRTRLCGRKKDRPEQDLGRLPARLECLVLDRHRFRDRQWRYFRDEGQAVTAGRATVEAAFVALHASVYYHIYFSNTFELTMSTTLTIKGQVTIPKHIRDALGLEPGMPVDFAINQTGEVVIHKATGSANRKPDRFETARGKADVKWRTQDLMALLRSEA
jgi:antitoxin PrlF